MVNVVSNYLKSQSFAMRILHQSSILLLLLWAPVVCSLQSLQSPLFQRQAAPRPTTTRLHLAAAAAAAAADITADNNSESSAAASSFAVDVALEQRYACTRFQRHDGVLNSTTSPSASNETVVNLALQALDAARRAPSGFNAQPYKLILVKTPEQKEALAKYCAGKNAYRVRDSDCTVVFLADKETGKSFGHYQRLLESKNPTWKEKPMAMLKLKCILALFSSGYPLLPRILAVPISFCVRLGVSIASLLFGWVTVIPTLASAETWASKNTMLVAMAYMMGCTSRGIQSCPMEGFEARGIRRVLKIPKRYSIPLIVATGNAYHKPSSVVVESSNSSSDDVGMEHGKPGTKAATPRYERDEMIFGDLFGQALIA